jgi:hypothetical protein
MSGIFLYLCSLFALLQTKVKEYGMMIEEAIIKPIEDYMAGNGELHRFPIVQSARDCCRLGLQTELHNFMEPYYIMYIDDSARLDWTSRGIISEIAHIDPYFGGWASRQDLMKMARAWAVRASGDDLLTLMDCMIQGGYEPWGSVGCYEEVTEELRYQRVNGNSGSGEIYALLHAFMSIVLSSHRYDRHKDMFLLLRNHWDFLRHVYSVMTGIIIGLGFSNFVGLANNLKNTKYQPYLHLVYWFLVDRADELCTQKQQKGMVKALASLQDIMDRTDPNPELDELCQLLFPKEVKEMLINHPKTPYRQLENEKKVLENENKVLKVENNELKAEKKALNEKLNVLARKQEEITLQMASELKKAFVEDAIPYSEIEEELLELPPKIVGNVFTILNDMLGGNEVWQRHFKELRKKVRKREKEKEVPQIDARHITMTGNDVTYNENDDKDD